MSIVHDKGWFILSAMLIAAIISGAAVFGIRQLGNDESIEITPPEEIPSTLRVYLTGAVANEGVYAFDDESSLGDILSNAGGYISDADTNSLEISIPYNTGDSPAEAQKININTADLWLLEALPEIGPTLATRIIDYREKEGLFNSIDELTGVEGIGDGTLEIIRDKITVID